MIDKKALYESLGQFVDLVATEEDGDREVMKEFIDAKAKNILEFVGDSQIKLDGDDVMVGGKKVGQVKVDHGNMDSGIDFVAADGKFSKEFADMQALYKFLSDRFNVKEGVLELDDETVIDLNEGRVEDAVLKQPAMKSDRAQRWAAVRGKVEKDGKEGDYDGGTEGNHSDPHKDAHGSEEGDGMRDSRHLKGYYDSADVRGKHKDPVRGGSDAAHPGGASDLDMDMSYDAHDVRKKHES